jgi:Na+/H+ antiporter NhaD/arsenite permease-like protein
MEPSLVAMAGAGILVLISGLDRELYLGSVEWETLLFFAGLFIMVGGLVRSSVVNNVPYAAAMTPIVGQFASSIPGHAGNGVLWWALLLGAVLGGNLTPIGASANVVAVGIAQRAGHPISFWDFTKQGAVVTLVSFVLSVGYLWLRYVAWS